MQKTIQTENLGGNLVVVTEKLGGNLVLLKIGVYIKMPMNLIEYEKMAEKEHKNVGLIKRNVTLQKRYVTQKKRIKKKIS